MKNLKKKSKTLPAEDLGVNLKSMGPSMDGKGFDIDLVGDPGKGENILQVFAAHFLAYADKEKGEHYIEMIATDPTTEKKCIVTVQRYEKRTPHQLRREAENDRDEIKKENQELKTEIKGLKAIIADQTEMWIENAKAHEKKMYRNDKADI